jgi:hypothetical protein
MMARIELSSGEPVLVLGQGSRGLEEAGFGVIARPRLRG